MYYQNNWRIHQRIPKKKKRIRTKRKERTTWMEWFQDWYQALHSLGWVCRNPGINEDRLRLTEDELSELSVLRMQRNETVICLYPSREALPYGGGELDEWINCTKPINRVVRIVRGRRPDPQRAVVRLADGTATNIIPIHPPFDTGPFLVDFDRGLFTPTGRGDWELTQDEERKAIYASYLDASPHFNSFRRYRQRPEHLVPHVCLLGCGSNPVGKPSKPLTFLR